MFFLSLADHYGIPPRMLEPWLPPSELYRLGLFYKIRADKKYMDDMGTRAEGEVRRRLVNRGKSG